MAKLHHRTKIIAFLIFFTLSLLQMSETALAASVRSSDVSKAGDGNILIGVPGSFERVNKTKILKRINEIRKEACVNGYINPATGKKLTLSDYVPIKWSSNLEWIAQLRAAESTVNESHTRPNGQSCFSITHKGEQSWTENLAWNTSGLMQGIAQWDGFEHIAWEDQDLSVETGHYTSLINPHFKYIGLGSFVRDASDRFCVSAEFSTTNSGSQTQSKLKGKVIQTIEVSKKNTESPKLSAPSTIKVKQTKKLSVTCTVTYPGIRVENNDTKGQILNGITWKSSKPSVLSVSSNGKITAKKAGKATITAKIKGFKTVKKTITVKK